MLNFKLLKKFLSLLIVIPAIAVIFFISASFFNKPQILKIEKIDIYDFKAIDVAEDTNYNANNINKDQEFSYKLIGIRSGTIDSSVILKKGNKEFLVYIGDTLEGSFELVEVNVNDALFRNGQKMYRIEKHKDK